MDLDKAYSEEDDRLLALMNSISDEQSKQVCKKNYAVHEKTPRFINRGVFLLAHTFQNWGKASYIKVLNLLPVVPRPTGWARSPGTARR